MAREFAVHLRMEARQSRIAGIEGHDLAAEQPCNRIARRTVRSDCVLGSLSCQPSCFCCRKTKELRSAFIHEAQLGGDSSTAQPGEKSLRPVRVA